jgi:hypothetical protein
VQLGDHVAGQLVGGVAHSEQGRADQQQREHPGPHGHDGQHRPDEREGVPGGQAAAPAEPAEQAGDQRGPESGADDPHRTGQPAPRDRTGEVLGGQRGDGQPGEVARRPERGTAEQPALRALPLIHLDAALPVCAADPPHRQARASCGCGSISRVRRR